METSVLTSKGQVLIPKRLRIKYGIKSGIKVAFFETSDGILIKALDENFFDRFAGMFANETPSLEEFKTWRDDDASKKTTSRKK